MFRFSGNFSRHFFALAGSSVAAQMLLLAAYPILCRLYTPEEMGSYAIFISLVTVFGVLATGRYEAGIPLPKTDMEARDIMMVALSVAAVLCTLILVACLPFRFMIHARLHWFPHADWLLLLCPAVFVAAAMQVLSLWATRKQHFRRLAASRLLQAVITVGVSVGMGTTNGGFLGLLTGWLCGNVVSVLYLYFLAIPRKDYNFSFHRLYLSAHKYVHFPRYAVGSDWLNLLSRELPNFLLGFYFSQQIVGWYSLANRLLSTLRMTIGNSVGEIFYAKAASLKNEDLQALARLTRRTAIMLTLCGIVLILPVLFFGPYIFRVVFGEEWEMAGIYAQWLSLWAGILFIVSPLSNLVNIMNKLKIHFFYNLLLFLSRLSVLVIGGLFISDALLTVQIYGLTGAVFSILFLLWLLHISGVIFPATKNIDNRADENIMIP